MSLRKIFYSLPTSLRFFFRRVYYFPQDIKDYIFNKINGVDDSLIPPKGLIYTGSGDFVKMGKSLMNSILYYCDTSPQDSILDIGSGIGRVAVPFTKFLSTEGKYEGFDVIKTGVDWCQNNISKKYPNFKFKYVALKNDLYRDSGEDASNFVFPYNDAQFDLVFLTSVFTHMLPNEVENYVQEISRVLKSGKKCYVTFFLLNERSESNPKFQFPNDYGNYKLMDEKIKGANVAYQENYLEQIFDKNQLKIKQKIYGFWSGIAKNKNNIFQDIIILEKL